jgi:predicted AAA+ superfamily ATPase
MLSNIEIDSVLSDWSFWDKSPREAIARSVLKKPVPITPDLPLVVQGIRRSGKSTLLSQIMQQKGIPREKAVFINFEDPRIAEFLDFRLLDAIVARTFERLGDLSECVFFLDEIQEVEGWERWFHARLERPVPACFLITGSNASLLGGKLGTVLTGRHRTIEVSPFDLSEYKLINPSGTFDTWILEGGFPRVLVDPEPATLLRSYFNQIIERGVRRHVAARSTAPLFRLVKSVYESTGSDLSLRSLAKTIDVATDTIKVWLDACQAAYLVLECPFFSWSERQRAARPNKYYPIDLALRDAVIARKGNDLGKRLETVVFHALRKRYDFVCYWKGKGEVDFVTQNNEGIVPWQVSWDAPMERHLKSLQEFAKAFPTAAAPRFIHRSNVELFLEECSEQTRLT